MFGQGSVHGFDDIAALAQLLEGVVYVGGKCPAAGFGFFRQSQPFQLPQPLDQAIALTVLAKIHFVAWPHVDRIVLPDPADEVAVKPGEAFLFHFPVKLLLDFSLGLQTQLAGQDLAGPVTDAMGDIVAGNVESLAVVGDAPDDDMGVGMAGVVVIHRHPVQAGLQIAFHLLHQLAGEALEVANASHHPPAPR